MITNPYAGTDTESGWSMGFAYGYMGPNFTDPPPAVIAPEQLDAFNEGRLAGQQAAIDGVAPSSQCYDTSQDVPDAAEGVLIGTHVLDTVVIVADIAAKHFARGFAGLAVLLFELTIPGPPPAAPEDVLPSLGAQYVDALHSLGIDSGDLFIAVGVDAQAAGCQLQFSNLFKTIDQAHQAADAMGRPHRVIAHWQMSASGNFEILEAS